MDQADLKDNLKQSDTHVSIAEGPSFTWQFAPARHAGDALPSIESFKATVAAKFNVVKLANCGGRSNKPSKRGRGDESDECGRAPTKKTRVGAGHSQAGPHGKRTALASGKVGNPGVPIPPDTGLVPIATSYPHEMKKLLRLDMFRKRVFEWFAGAPCVPAGALCLALAELGLDTRDQSTHTSWWTSYVLWAAAFAHQDIMQWGVSDKRRTLLVRQLSNAVGVALSLDPSGRQNLTGAAELIVEGYMGTPIVRTPMLHAAQHHSQDGYLNG